MKNKKRVFSCVMCVVLIMSMSIPGFALTTQITLNTGYNQMIAEIQLDNSISDRIKLEQLTELYFEAKEENFLAKERIDLTGFYSPQKKSTMSTDTSDKLFEFEKIVRSENSGHLCHEAFDVNINDVIIDGDTAVVNAAEYYEYIHDSNKTILSSRTINYCISYVKDGTGNWSISNITTDNELEKIVDTVDSVYHVSDLFSKEAFVAATPDPEIESARSVALREQLMGESSNQLSRSSLTRYWYNSTTAKNYALEYSDSSNTNSTTSSYNDRFFVTEGYDCQSFVSQCIWAGLGGQNYLAFITGRERPMITESGREWWATNYGYSINWCSVPDFANYVSTGGSNKYGLYGTVGSVGAIASTYVGDAIQIRDSSGWYHTYFVSEATGTPGSRTTSNLYVCAHTANRHNELLNTIVGSSAANLRTVAITGSYY